MPVPEASIIFAQAQQQEREGKIADAERGYREFLTLRPEDANALHGLGRLCFQSGRRAEGMDFLRRALLVQPDNPYLHVTYATMLGTIGKLEESAAAIRRAIGFAPEPFPKLPYPPCPQP